MSAAGTVGTVGTAGPDVPENWDGIFTNVWQGCKVCKEYYNIYIYTHYIYINRQCHCILYYCIYIYTIYSIYNICYV